LQIQRKVFSFSDFRRSRYFIVDIDPALLSLHPVDVGSVAGVSEEHQASISRAEMCAVDDFPYIYVYIKVFV
jgi:hypothetical protein